MSGLTGSIQNAAGALTAFSRLLETVQNNVANASTPGYAKQSRGLSSIPMDTSAGTLGGVRAGAIESARDIYAEQAVRRETQLLGYAEQRAASLAPLESVFSVSGESGLTKALTDLFQSFSAWGQNPESGSSRQSVIENAENVARAFNQASSEIGALARNTESQLRSVCGQVNELTRTIAEINRNAPGGAARNPALGSKLYSTLEELSRYVDASAIEQADGSITVLLDGEIPLVMGGRSFDLTYELRQPESPPATYPTGAPRATVICDGSDVTGHAASGSLGALLDVRNSVVPSYLGDTQQPGDLNVLATEFADRVNEILEQGRISDGPPVVPGIPLFTYQGTGPGVAQSLSLTDAITPEKLAAIDLAGDRISNGIPLRLAALAEPQDPADQVGGRSYLQFYGTLAGRAGSELGAAKEERAVRQATLSQAKAFREEISGVSLDEEAVALMEFQRSYQAVSRLITILDGLAEEAINMIR